MFIAFFTLFFLGVFTLLYISKAIGNKSEGMAKAVARITDNIDQLALWGVIYGVVGAILTMLVIHGSMILLFVCLIANALIVVMALPFTFEKVISKKAATMNAAILETLRETVATISSHEKTIGFIGCGVEFLLLAVMFS